MTTFPAEASPPRPRRRFGTMSPKSRSFLKFFSVQSGSSVVKGFAGIHFKKERALTHVIISRLIPYYQGALIGIDPLNPLASIVVFQFSPDTLVRVR